MSDEQSLEVEGRLAAIEAALLVLFGTHPSPEALKAMLRGVSEGITNSPDGSRTTIARAARSQIDGWIVSIEQMQQQLDQLQAGE